jgi:hypothetical protein
MMTTSLCQVESLRVGDRFREALGLLDLIGNIDLGAITKIISQIGELRNAEDTRGQVTAGLELLRLISAATPNETDDKIAKWMTRVIAGDLLAVVVNTVDWLKKRAAGQSVQMTFDAATLDTVEAAGFDLGMLIQIAQMILAMIERFGK